SLENRQNEQHFERIGKKIILNEKRIYFKEKTLPSYLALMDASTIFQENKLAGNIKIPAIKTISNYIMPNIYYVFLSKNKVV
ncbi:LysR family transcriptional regulator, partial [Aliarcobacter butzleri]